MKQKFWLICILCFFLFLFLPSRALAIEDPTSVPNNHFGVHILFAEEVGEAARLINSNGGDWGYVTIPIQATDRNLEKWQKFMDDCRRSHIVPIIRIATYVQGSTWTKPIVFDHLDFANFLGSLSWPTINRYVVVYNEPNTGIEWEGQVDAASYARELSLTIDVLKRVNSDFFVIAAGLDSYAPNSGNLYKNSYTFMLEMDRAVPGIFAKIDGFASHSYPNSNFSENPVVERRGGITTYREEVSFIKRYFRRDNLPIFITETGWENKHVSEETIADFYNYAFTNIWREQNIVAITPFLLNGAHSAFSGFSLLNPDGSSSKAYSAITSLPKSKGQPHLAPDRGRETIQASRTVVKNFSDGQSESFMLTVSSPLRTMLKWLFY